MSDSTGHDPRSIANLIIDIISRNHGKPPTNLALQKLLYFSHGMFLVKTKIPLVSGYFIAWKYGPIHPVVYAAFKTHAGQPIYSKAEKIDIFTGLTSEIPPPGDEYIVKHIERVVIEYGSMTAGRLVEVSHAKNSPWHFTVTQSGDRHVYGARIENIVIEERFKYHKVSIGSHPRSGEPIEEEPTP